MQLSNNETMFLNMIKPTCIKQSVENHICPSVMAALAIDISEWGSSRLFSHTRNVYGLKANKEDWFDSCYSLKTNKIYENPSECDEYWLTLYRVYSKHEISVQDFIDYMATARMSSFGPPRYASLDRCSDYVEALKRLQRAEFDIYYLGKRQDQSYWGHLQNLIEDYKLYEWDEELKKAIKEEENTMSKKRYIYIDRNRNVVDTPVTESTEEENTINEEVVEENSQTIESEIEHIYRVRLDWDRPDTQIYASTEYTSAKEEAMKHEGYKIYIDDDGELFEDPWEGFYNTTEEATESDPDIRTVVHPIPGKSITLNNTPVFKKAIDKTPFCYLSGNFYFYDNTVVLGRAKITKVKNTKNPSDPHLILGYINI